MSTEFQLLLKQAKQKVKTQPETATEQNTRGLDKEFQKMAQALPSEIKIAPKKVLKPEPVIKEKKSSKINSFSKLMKLAKLVKPEGLIRDASKPAHPNAVRETFAKNSVPLSHMKQQNQVVRSRLVGTSHPSQTIIKRKPIINSTKVKIDGKGRLNSKSGVQADLIKLNVKKRDLATIEEIEEERRLKKLNIQQKPSLVKQSMPPITKKIKPSAKSTILRNDKQRTEHQKPPQKNNYSSIISSMFGYDRSRYRDDSSDDDMEVGFGDLEREEKRSFKIAKREDLEEERKEMERERKKLEKRK
jgi:hypothetical protein